MSCVKDRCACDLADARANERTVFLGRLRELAAIPDAGPGWKKVLLQAAHWLETGRRPLRQSDPPETVVEVVQDNGSTVVTKTRSDPWKLGNGTLVVLYHGRTGCYPASRVFVLNAEAVARLQATAETHEKGNEL